VVTEASKALVEAFVGACGEERRAWVEGIAADVRHDRLRAAALEHEHESRCASALAKLRSSYADRFGAAPHPRLTEITTALDARTLELAALLVEDSNSAQDLALRLEILERACLEERRRGAAHVLFRMLERRFGYAMVYKYDDLCRTADAYDLDGCFTRLESATSVGDVLGPLLHRLDERVRERYRATAPTRAP